MHLVGFFDGLLNDQAKKYASFDLHGMEPSMQENGQKNSVQSSMKSHPLCVTL